jgi:2-dehydropantoate 2-reductase
VLSPQIEVDLWLKFIRLSVFSGMTSMVRAPIGVVRRDPALRMLLESAVREGIAVATARGIALPAGTYDSTIAGLMALPPHAKASMFEDLERARRLELPWLSGTMVRIAAAAGVPAPTHQLFVTLLTPFVDGTPALTE